jgi:hypothetical protein
MAQPATILPFYSGSTTVDTHTGDAFNSTPSDRVRKSDVDVNLTDVSSISIDDLYPASEVSTPELSIALRLLAKDIECVDEALVALQRGDQIAADDAMQQVHASLPELFNCRVLGDGYGEVINALLSSFENRNGIPLNNTQILTIRQILSHTRATPFMKFDSALDLVEKLEKANFVVEPKGFEYLADWLDE